MAQIVLISPKRHLTIGSSDRAAHLRRTKEAVDDWDKSASFNAGEAPRRSTSSLDENVSTCVNFRGTD